MREVLVALGLVPRGGNYETVWRRIEQLGLHSAHLRRFERGRGIRDRGEVELIHAIESSRSFAEVLRKLGIRPGGNQERLKKRVEELGLDISHFIGEAWRRGSRTATVPARPLEEVLVLARWTQTNDLKHRLLAEGLKERRCEVCRLHRWNDLPIPLELDHLNGRRDDNRLSNLRIVCPNCHAQTRTYRGRNIGIDQLS
jgi:hypothetical protein